MCPNTEDTGRRLSNSSSPAVLRKDASYLMNEHERYLFDLQGFLVVEDALLPEQVAALNRLADQTLADETDPAWKTKRFDPIPWGQPYHELLQNPRLTPVLAEMLGDGFRLDHSYVDVIRTGLGPIGAILHGGATPFDPSQYYLFQNGSMFSGLTVVAYNLKDVGLGDGGFGCIPGSHKSNYPTPKDWLDLGSPAPCAAAVPGKAGSAVIFTEALTHGTLPWRGAEERRTLFLKYCPEHMAWSRHYPTGGDQGELTEEQRRVLRTPGIWPK
jgi:hypothetical protein